MTLTPAQEVAQKLAQMEAHSQAPATDAVAGTPAHDDASQPGAQAQRAAMQAQQPAAQSGQASTNCCAASEYLPDRAVAYVVDQRLQKPVAPQCS